MVELSAPYEWKSTVGGARKHAVNAAEHFLVSACGVSVWTFDRWRNNVDELPACKSCMKKLPS